MAGAAVVCTATSTSDSTPLVAAGWVAPGAHVNVIGGTHEDAVEVDPGRGARRGRASVFRSVGMATEDTAAAAALVGR